MNEKIKKGYEYIYIFLLIFVEFGYYSVVAGGLPVIVRIISPPIAIIPLLFINRKANSKSLVLVIYLVLLILLNSLRGGNIFDYFMLANVIIAAFLITVYFDVKKFLKIFNNIMCFLAIYSLVIYLLALNFPSVIQRFPLLGQVYGQRAEIHNLFFSVAITNSINVRNYGLAWEPGAFALLLCIALLYSLFFDEIRIKRIILLVTTIITTFSTSGYIAMGGLLIARIIKEEITRQERRFVRIIVLVIFLFGVFAPQSIMELTFSKLNGLFGNNDIAYTTMSRINAIYYPGLAFFNSPIVGVGYEKFAWINKNLCDSVATNTIVNWFACLGLIFGLPCTIGLFSFVVKCCKVSKLNVISVILFMVSLTLLFSTESLFRISLVYSLIFWGYNSNWYDKTIIQLEEEECNQY